MMQSYQHAPEYLKKNVFLHLMESMPLRTGAVLRAKGVPEVLNECTLNDVHLMM